MTVLLTGGAGYIGSHTAVELLNAGHDVVIADNYANSNPIVARRITQITGKPVKCYEVDVADPAALERLFQENAIDSVIHFAGLKAVGESVRLPLDYYRNNLDSTLALLAAMEAHGVRQLIFSSSATVYGKHAALPYREDAETGPCTNPYGWTKLFIEQIIRDYAAAHPDFSVVLLRYFNPVGAHESGLMGEDPRDIPNNLMPYIAKVAVGKLEKVHVFGNDYPTPDGTGVRDYIHVVDLARGHVSALNYMRGKHGVHVFNLGTGHGYSVLDVIHAFERACGKELPYEICPRRDGDIAETYCDASKAKELMGWEAQYDIDDMCAHSWKWQSMNPNGYQGATE